MAEEKATRRGKGQYGTHFDASLVGDLAKPSHSRIHSRLHGRLLVMDTTGVSPPVWRLNLRYRNVTLKRRISYSEPSLYQ
jgi:hypothetical protein